MAYTKTIWRTGETPLSAENMNNIEEGIGEALVITRRIAEIVYPVGCYFETTDTSFDPNTAFGGTWVLETEGQVHISSGANYVIAGGLTNTSDGGTTTSETQNHTLTLNEIPSHNHVNPTYSGKDIRTYGTNEKSRGTTSWGWGEYVKAYNLFVSAGGGQAHNHGSVDTMQPYIVVNRWHRTA